MARKTRPTPEVRALRRKVRFLEARLAQQVEDAATLDRLVGVERVKNCELKHQVTMLREVLTALAGNLRMVERFANGGRL